MRYATWKLDFSTGVGMGPEPLIVSTGGTCEGGFYIDLSNPTSTILGYFDADIQGLDMSTWSFTELTSDEALLFLADSFPNAFFLEDGRIATGETES